MAYRDRQGAYGSRLIIYKSLRDLRSDRRPAGRPQNGLQLPLPGG